MFGFGVSRAGLFLVLLVCRDLGFCLFLEGSLEGRGRKRMLGLGREDVEGCRGGFVLERFVMGEYSVR